MQSHFSVLVIMSWGNIQQDVAHAIRVLFFNNFKVTCLTRGYMMPYELGFGYKDLVFLSRSGYRFSQNHLLKRLPFVCLYYAFGSYAENLMTVAVWVLRYTVFASVCAITLLSLLPWQWCHFKAGPTIAWLFVLGADLACQSLCLCCNYFSFLWRISPEFCNELIDNFW